MKTVQLHLHKIINYPRLSRQSTTKTFQIPPIPPIDSIGCKIPVDSCSYSYLVACENNNYTKGKERNKGEEKQQRVTTKRTNCVLLNSKSDTHINVLKRMTHPIRSVIQ